MSELLEEFVAHLVEFSIEDENGARRLPPERDLGEALQMSRGALREKLSQLDVLGVLRRRQGDGTYLEVPDLQFVRSYFTLLRILGHLDDTQFDDARIMLEITAVAAAATLVRPSDIEVLRALVAVMIAHTKAGDAEKALISDIEFHSRIYEIVDNPIFNMLNEGLSHVLRDTLRTRRALALSIETPEPDGSFNTDNVHIAIVDALEARDPEGARAAMRQHFDDYSLLVLHGHGQKHHAVTATADPTRAVIEGDHS